MCSPRFERDCATLIKVDKIVFEATIDLALAKDRFMECRHILLPVNHAGPDMVFAFSLWGDKTTASNDGVITKAVAEKNETVPHVYLQPLDGHRLLLSCADHHARKPVQWAAEQSDQQSFPKHRR